MKKLLSVLAFVFAFASVNAQSQVGDVVHSVLPPSQFVSLHPEWMLLDGCQTAESKAKFLHSKLHMRLGISSLPDARGVFLRGMNEGRDAKTGDPAGNRILGTPQLDAIKTHSHNFKFPQTGPISSGPGNPGAIEAIGGYRDIPTAGELAEETRPKNIALYVYIKVN